jgi:hypothetical protein
MVGYCEQPEFLNNVVLPLVGVSFSLMLALLALFYVASQFFKKAEYESFVSLELHQLLISALLIATIFSASYFSCVIAVGFAGDDMFAIGSRYLNYMSNDLSLRAVLFFEGLKMFAQYWGSMSFRWGLSVWGLSSSGFPSFIVIERVADFLLLLVTPFSASLMVQEIILQVIQGIAIPFVLPVGAVLRIFPPTRDAGSFLMASALGFSIIYPFTYVMHQSIVPNMVKNAMGEEGFEQVLVDRGQSDLWVFSPIYKGYGYLFDVDNMIYKPVIAISFLLLQALFLPALSMILTISFIKGIAKFFSQKMG